MVLLKIKGKLDPDQIVRVGTQNSNTGNQGAGGGSRESNVGTKYNANADVDYT